MDVSTKALSAITTHMKYGKYNSKLKRRETWDEIVDRNMAMHLKKFPQLETEIRQNYQYVYDKKVLPSMRSIQFAGKPIEIAPNRMYNCAYLPIDDIRSFAEIMMGLLGGSGMGVSVQQHHVSKLPEIRKPFKDKTRRFLIGDSIEGWADAVEVLVKAYFRGGSRPIFDFRDIRQKGARLVTSGGKAPGPQPLKECLIKLEGILDSKENGDKLSPIEAYDIVCHIADAVLAGGIRRAAVITLFTATDNEMMGSKSGEWWEANPQRGRSNNSVVLMRHKITKEYFMEIWNRVRASGAGEPGFYFSNDKDLGCNPCITGDALITVKDHSTVTGNNIVSDGVTYKIPLEQLVELYHTSEYPPLILSMNIETGVTEWDYMDDATLTRYDADVIELELIDGSSIKLTPDHKVFTKNRGYVSAKDLNNADILVKLIKT